MPAVPTKRPKAAAVKQSSIQDTNAFLQALPDKPKEELSLREAVEQMRDSVRSALAKGYTYQELAAMLTEKGIKISAFTLKNYVPSGRRRSSKDMAEKEAAPKKRGRRSKAEMEAARAAAEAAAADTPLNGAAAAAPKATRGRKKGSVAAKTAAEPEATVKKPTTRRRQSPAAASTESKPATRGRKKAAM